MFYSGYYFFGMHLIWWFFWILFVISIFVLLKRIPKNRYNKEMPLEILKNRLATGSISSQEYLEKKKLLENDLSE